jgi:hypothetical protein
MSEESIRDKQLLIKPDSSIGIYYAMTDPSSPNYQVFLDNWFRTYRNLIRSSYLTKQIRASQPLTPSNTTEVQKLIDDGYKVPGLLSSQGLVYMSLVLKMALLGLILNNYNINTVPITQEERDFIKQICNNQDTGLSSDTMDYLLTSKFKDICNLYNRQELCKKFGYDFKCTDKQLADFQFKCDFYFPEQDPIMCNAPNVLQQETDCQEVKLPKLCTRDQIQAKNIIINREKQIEADKKIKADELDALKKIADANREANLKQDEIKRNQTAAQFKEDIRQANIRAAKAAAAQQKIANENLKQSGTITSQIVQSNKSTSEQSFSFGNIIFGLIIIVMIIGVGVLLSKKSNANQNYSQNYSPNIGQRGGFLYIKKPILIMYLIILLLFL